MNQGQGSREDHPWNASSPYRTAGGNTQTGPSEENVRDWQRNTWYGPAPNNLNPFDEPDDAPELRDSRSENVNQHVGDFWKEQQEGYQYTSSQPVGQAADQTKKRKRRADRPKKNRMLSEPMRTLLLRTGLTVLAVLTVAALILFFVVYTVQDIQVIGNKEISAEEIIRISGLRQGESILMLDDQTIGDRIRADYRLQYRYLMKNMPNQVVLCVQEREACCWMTYGGVVYEIDKHRMVMSESEDLVHTPTDLVEVKGLNIRSGARRGQRLVLSSTEQQTAFSELFLEMKVLNCASLIQEVDLSKTSSMLMQTRDGYTVSLGNQENLHAKLRSLLLVRQELLNRGLTGGSISVINPKNPLYSPAE